MGIFDDAIRQHLDLKRRQGADESELKQLEDEAFGLPARPGDPDFPETGEAATGEEAVRDDEASAAVAEEPITGSEEAQPAPTEPREEPAPHGDALLADPEAEPAPPPTEEGPVEDTGAASFTTSEREAIAAQPTEFFDRAPEEFELDELDLDLEEEVEKVGALEEQPLTDEELAEEAQPPAADAEVAEEVEPASEPEPADEPAAPSEPQDSASEGEGEADDVLEETPEFLRDNPDDDELWFEQGEPKDFDF